jgi:hypothetical protein
MTSPVGATTFTPYSTVRSLLGTLPDWLAEMDALRLTSYGVYEQIYWNVPETFVLVARGTDTRPIYVPTGRVICDTTNRYLAAGFSWNVTEGSAPTGEIATATEAFKALFDRERFVSKFNAAKLDGLIKGDWGWHVLADPAKPPGARITLKAIDPGSMFKIFHPDDIDRVMGVDLIDVFMDGDDQLVRVQRYSKGVNPYDPSTEDGLIYTFTAIFTLDDYGDPTKRPVRTVDGPRPLPPQITALPVYHIPNNETVGNPYGSSEMRGLERIMAAVNQAISDEELALALEGLGMYATDAGQPVDPDTGQKTNWRMGPGRVLNLPTGTKMDRINGVSSVTPYMDHLAFLINSMKDASGTTDAAAGKVDVQVAESGIALTLQLAPMLAKVATRDTTVVDIHRHMFFDLRAWLQAFEGINIPNAIVEPVLGEKIPINKTGELNNILAVLEATGMVDWALRELTKLGYTFTAEDLAAALANRAAATADPFADRATAEIVA